MDAPLRLRVPPTFSLPHLGGVDGVVAAVPQPSARGTTVVADTDDLVLVGWGVRLTHEGDAWRLRLPAHPAGAASPTQHRLPTRSATLPALARHALARLADGREIRRVVRLVVRRTPVLLVDDHGEPLARVADEEVSVHTGRRLTGRFREVVVQGGPDAPDGLVAAVEASLREAGALGREDVPRDVRVLGPVPGGPDLPDAAGPAAVPAAWAGAVRQALHDLLLVDVHLRLDDDGVVAGPSLPVVDRVAGLALLLDAPTVVRAPVATLRELLEQVDRLVARREAVEVPDDAAPGLVEAAAGELAVAVRRLHAHLDGDDHVAAVAGLRELVRDPLVAPDEHEDVRTSVAARVGTSWPPVVAGLATGEPGQELELAALAAGAAVAPGKAPARFARDAARAAAAARDHARAADVQRWLRATAVALPAEEAFVAGRLAGRRADDPGEAVREWDEALERLLRDKSLRWLDEAAADGPDDDPEDDG